MSKKLYDHLILTNYAEINTKIKKETKKSGARKVHRKQNNVSHERNNKIII